MSFPVQYYAVYTLSSCLRQFVLHGNHSTKIEQQECYTQVVYPTASSVYGARRAFFVPLRVDIACDVWANPPAVVSWYKHQADISFPALQQKVRQFPLYAA